MNNLRVNNKRIKISYSDYISEIERVYNNAYTIIEDISEDSPEVYFVETLFGENILLHTPVIPYKSACLKTYSDIKEFVKKNTPKGELCDLVSWCVSRYTNKEKIGSYQHCYYTILLDCNAEILHVGLDLEYLEEHENEMSPKMKQFLDNWDKSAFYGPYISNWDKKFIIKEPYVTVTDFPFQKGDILEYKYPWNSNPSFLIYIGRVKCDESEWFFDAKKEIRTGPTCVYRFFDENIKYIKRATDKEHIDLRTLAASELVVNDDNNLYNLIAEYIIAEKYSDSLDVIAERIESIIKAAVNPDSTKALSWNSDSDEDFNDFMEKFQVYLQKIKPLRITLDELRDRVELFLKKAKDSVLVDCNEKELYSVENVFRKGTYEGNALELKKGLFKNYKDVNAQILNYSFDYIESNDCTDKSLKDFMFFVVKKYTLDYHNKYNEICSMIFNTDAELIDIKFSSRFEEWCCDDEQLAVYKEWKMLNSDMKNQDELFLETPKYGEILKFSMKPIYEPIEFVFLKHEEDNDCYGFFREDREYFMSDGIDQAFRLGLGLAGAWTHVYKTEACDCFLKELSEFLKKYPEAEDGIWDLADEELPKWYFPIEDVEAYIKNYKHKTKNEGN